MTSNPSIALRYLEKNYELQTLQELTHQEAAGLEAVVESRIDLDFSSLQEYLPGKNNVSELSPEERKSLAHQLLLGLQLRALHVLLKRGYTAEDIAGYTILQHEDAERYRYELEEERQRIKNLPGREDLDVRAFHIIAARFFLKQGKTRLKNS